MQDSDFYRRFSVRVRTDLPKHVQLRDTMLAAIEAGVWKQGERLPNENALTGMTPFSLGTVQRALRSLTEDGVLVRKQGAGSFVSSTSRLLPYPLHCRFVNDAGNGFLPIYSKTLQRVRAAGEAVWQGRLGSDRGPVMRIDRSIDVNGEFVVYSRFFAATGDLGSLSRCSIRKLDGQNFKQMMARELNIPITGIQNFARAEPIPREAAAVIGCRASDPGLYLVAIAASAARNVYVQDFYIPPTTRQLALNPALTRPEP